MDAWWQWAYWKGLDARWGTNFARRFQEDFLAGVY
jgi:hypothetical protein